MELRGIRNKENIEGKNGLLERGIYIRMCIESVDYNIQSFTLVNLKFKSYLFKKLIVYLECIILNPITSLLISTKA